ncbi:tail fiber domain-containing protein, partial [bacterium]|nr:tail fiber domain-containing protein [bacterium]
GFDAMRLTEAGNQSVAIGQAALEYWSRGNNTSTHTTAIGDTAGKYTTGSYNTFVGSAAGQGGTTGAPYSSGINNTAVGYQALKSFTTIGGITAVGYQSLTALTTGVGNSGFADRTLKLLTTGQYNTALGNQAMENTVDGTKNTAVGYQAGGYFLNDYSTAVGFSAGKTASGSHNTFVGNEAGLGGGGTSAPYSSGQYNVAVGSEALKAFTTGNSNVGVGYRTLYSLTTGGGNTVLGNSAGDALNTGGQNVAIGDNALGVGTTASNNVVVGGRAADAFNGNQNVIIGQSAMGTATGTTNSVIVGFSAGGAMTSGGPNTLIGTYTNVHTGAADNVICLGYAVTGTANHRVHIGDNTSHIYNDYNSNATWTHSSDKRQKKNIEDDKLGLDFINDIRPVTFEHKSPSEFPKEWNAYDADNKEPMGGGGKIHGLIAQEVKEALDKQDIDTFGGWDETPDGRQHVSFEAFVLPLIKSVQELTEMVKAQQKEIEELKKK